MVACQKKGQGSGFIDTGDYLIHKAILDAVSTFAGNNYLPIYNDFQSVMDIICRKKFVEKFNQVIKDKPNDKRPESIKFPETIFFEREDIDNFQKNNKFSE